jgi:hypothetical protein
VSGWRSIFINVPLGVQAAAAVRRVPPGLAPGRQPGARFDLPGLVLLAAGVTGLLLGAARVAAGGASWAAATTWAPLAAGVLLLAAYAWWAGHRDQPALDLSLARQRVPLLSMLLAIGAATPLWVIATILACRSASTGLVINPLLQALTHRLRPDQLADGNTLFNTWQRIAGSFGIGLIAAIYTTQATTHGPVRALHLAGLIITAISLAAALLALLLPAHRNVMLGS